MEAWLKDVKFGAKLLLRDRGFSTTAVLTIALEPPKAPGLDYIPLEPEDE